MRRPDKPAPTGGECSFTPRLCCCCCSAFDLAFDLDLRRPVKPRWPQAGIAQWAPRHGCRGSRDTAMDGRSRRAHGAMPDCGHAEPRRGTEWWGKSPFGYFWGSFPKVTRCKSGTLSGRDRSNGYVPNPTPEEPHITDSERCTHWPLPGSQLPSSRADAGSLAGPARSNW
jgi:hypothetical protein